jgi:hypothetical protein
MAPNRTTAQAYGRYGSGANKTTGAGDEKGFFKSWFFPPDRNLNLNPSPRADYDYD